MSNTPETDAEVNELKSSTTYNMVYVSFARKLERERDAYADALRSIHLITIDGEDIWADLEEITTIAHNALHHHE